MKDIRDILDASAALKGETAALATVVKKRGSVYRQPGARLLIRRDKTTVGSISGGCLENDVVAKAVKLMDSGKTELAVFDMTAPDDDLWGYGQGCNGIISVLIEPLGGGCSADPFSVFSDAISHRRRSVLVTIFRVEGEVKVLLGSRMALSDSGKVVENVRNPVITSALTEEADRAFRKGTSGCREIRTTEGIVEAFFEVVHPPVLLIIAGGGTDAIPVHRIAAELGWQVWVTDHRPAFAVKERFPLADKLLPGRAEDVAGTIPVDSRTAVVIMTHQVEHDRTLLRHFLGKAVPYIGLLGPAKRSKLLLQGLADEGFELTAEHRSRLFSPVGLSLGAETPEEIALAIISEIQTVISGHLPGFMRDKRGSIHGQDDRNITT